MPAGRPISEVPQDKADSVVEWISSGQTLRSWCRLPGNPSPDTIENWQKKDDEFARRIARARELGEQAISEECFAIADTPQIGQIITVKPDGTEEIKTEDMLGHRKLQIETRLKLLAKWNPRKWGDKTDVSVSGNLGLTLVNDIPRPPKE